MKVSVPELDALADALADRILERLAKSGPEPDGLIDAAEVARRLGITRSTVYEIADQLGAIRLGEGERPRLRFDPHRIEERLATHAPSTSNGGNGRKPRRSVSTVELLPINGERP
jgi:hypothetical protein